MDEVQEKKWHRLLGEYKSYAFAVVNDYNLMFDIEAIVREKQNGEWLWEATSMNSISPYANGVEASRELAQQAAEKFLESR